jgi:hypothetical protein
LDWKLEEFWVIGRFLGKWEIFGFSYFHRSTLLDKKLVIGQILGNWEILVN